MHSDHHGLELLEVEECLRLLRSKSVGRLGLSASSLPIVLPVRYVVDDDRILLATGRDTRMAAATRDTVVAFEVDDFDSDPATGWSVMVQGRASELAEGVDAPGAEALSSWIGSAPVRCVCIPMEFITGQRLHADGGPLARS